MTVPVQESAPNTVRIIVASPGDVPAEREALSRVIDGLNTDVARGLGFDLRLWRWETDAYPGFHTAGPQRQIDDLMQIADSDIVIGIFWKRFGTPVSDARSGTEHELRRAIEAWKRNGHPEIMLYFNKSTYSLQTSAEADQLKAVLAFHEEFSAQALMWSFEGVQGFETLVRQHLTSYLQQRSKQLQQAAHEADKDRREDANRSHLSRWFHTALDFFDDRLNEAFPGVRGLQIYSGPEAFTRLGRLLRDPLTIQDNGKESAPLWWWHGLRGMNFTDFRVLDGDKLRCLIGRDELLINQVAVYRNHARPYKSFVYILTHADNPTGIRPFTADDIQGQLEWDDSAWEEVGYWKGRYISRTECDDGHAEINGEIVRVEGAEIRFRYLTPYNLFITSQTSVFNSIQVDMPMAQLCQSLLEGTAKLDDIVNAVETLELSGRIGDLYFWDA